VLAAGILALTRELIWQWLSAVQLALFLFGYCSSQRSAQPPFRHGQVARASHSMEDATRGHVSVHMARASDPKSTQRRRRTRTRCRACRSSGACSCQPR
jgi:hypothetical protein